MHFHRNNWSSFVNSDTPNFFSVFFFGLSSLIIFIYSMSHRCFYINKLCTTDRCDRFGLIVVGRYEQKRNCISIMCAQKFVAFHLALDDSLSADRLKASLLTYLLKCLSCTTTEYDDDYSNYVNKYLQLFVLSAYRRWNEIRV